MVIEERIIDEWMHRYKSVEEASTSRASEEARKQFVFAQFVFVICYIHRILLCAQPVMSH